MENSKFQLHIDAGQSRIAGWRQRRKSFRPGSVSAFSLLLLLSPVPGGQASAQSYAPLVYDSENTGANYPKPVIRDFSQLPIVRPLPDPFAWFDASPRDTTFASWEHHRNDLLYSIGTNEIGVKPDCSDCTIDAVYTPSASSSVPGLLKTVVTRNGRSLTLNSQITLPTGRGPFPFVIGISLAPGTGPFTGSLPSGIFTSRNIATVEYLHDDVTQYSAGQMVAHNTDPFFLLYPELCAGTCPASLSNAGQYVAWAWGVSRVLDGIKIASTGINVTNGTLAGSAGQTVNILPLDMRHSAVTGCSYAGKMALYAGALDERIALTIAQENGGGGVPSWRVSHEIEANNSVEDIHDTDYDWFGSQMKKYIQDGVYKMPHDHHELAALVAPRALLETGNTDYYWLSNRSNYVSARATQQIYSTLGIGDRFGFYIDGGHSHCAVLDSEIPSIQAFVDKYLAGLPVTTNVQVNPFPTLDYKRWTAWWGTNKPTFPDDWNTQGAVVLSMNTNLAISSGDNVMAGYSLAMPGPHPAATVSIPGGNVQVDLSCPDGSSQTLAVPFAAQSYTIPANDNYWTPTDDPQSPLVFQGSATAAGCYGATAKAAYFSALGATSSSGNPGGPGFVSPDTVDPLLVRFHISVNGTTASGWSQAVRVNFN